MISKTMINLSLSLLITVLFSSFLQCTYTDSQAIDLHDTGTFVIGSYDGDYNDEDESEMIQPKDIEHIESLSKDEEKFIPLHFPDLSRFRNNLIRSLKWMNDGKLKERKKSKRSDDDKEDEDIEDETTYPSKTNKPKSKADTFQEFEITSDEFDNSSLQPPGTPDVYDYETYDEETTQSSPSTKIKKISTTPTSSTQETSTIVQITGATTTITATVQSSTASVTESIATEETTSEAMLTTETLSSTSTLNYEENNKQTTTYTSAESEKTEITSKTYASASTENNMVTQIHESTTPITNEQAQEIPTISVEKMTITVTEESTEESSTTAISKHATDKTKKTSLKQTTARQKGDRPAITIRKTTVKQSTEVPTTEEIETTEPMDYEKIAPQYDLEIEDIKTANVTFDYTEDEIHKSLQKLMKKALDIRKPRNCSQFDGFNYGFKAFGCALEDFHNSHNRTQVSNALGRTWKIVRIWLLIYICIAIPCWCQYGWCCCCCRCAICFPRRAIMQDQKYFADNPPGTLADKDQPATYEPTIFEEDAYEQFEKTIRHL